jgi:hypothetical protein
LDPRLVGEDDFDEEEVGQCVANGLIDELCQCSQGL